MLAGIRVFQKSPHTGELSGWIRFPWNRSFKPRMQGGRVPKIRFHDLRHTAVAIMLSHGVSIFQVSKIIGHARPSITSDIYGHLVPGAADDIGQMMDALIASVPAALESS